jgi:hypothetical protein
MSNRPGHDKDLAITIEQVRAQIPWSLVLFDVVELDASIDQIAAWVEGYAEDLGIQLLSEGGGPIEPGKLAEYFAAMESWHKQSEANAEYEVGLFKKNAFSGHSVWITLVITPLPQDGIHLALYNTAVFAHEAHYFYQVRDSLRESFPQLPKRSTPGAGAPYLMNKGERRRLVEEWRKAKARGMTKTAFSREVIVPGNLEPGISTKTLTRYEKEFPNG